MCSQAGFVFFGQPPIFKRCSCGVIIIKHFKTNAWIKLGSRPGIDKIIAKAYNGEEAVKLFHEFRESPDLILMDHRMPKKDGLTAAEEILSLDDEIKIIFFSADYTIKEKALALGAKYFLEKPFQLDKLTSIIEKIISEG